MDSSDKIKQFGFSYNEDTLEKLSVNNIPFKLQRFYLLNIINLINYEPLLLQIGFELSVNFLDNQHRGWTALPQIFCKVCG